MKIFVLLGVCRIYTAERDSKLLNVFNVIRFPNDACITSGNTNGVCYSASECRTRGGNAQGTCASSFGVCCAFIGTCGGSSSENNTYFRSTSSDSSPCRFSVCKTSDNICQLRLNFDAFDIAQPNTVATTEANVPQGRTQCQKAQFTVSSAGASPPVICGSNQAYHMIVEASDDCNIMNFNWLTNASPNNWDIHIMQIPCDAKWKPPEGCLQYYTGSTGYIQSYNYAGGIHLANQDYNNCIRTERNFCSMQYTQVSNTDFSMDGEDADAEAGDDCVRDYVIIHGGGSANVVTANLDRFCGALLADADNAAAATTIFTQRMPYQLGVFTDGSEVGSAVGTNEQSGGFYIYYNQVAC